MNHRINKEVQFQTLGQIDYQECWTLQENLMKGIIDVKVNNRLLDLDEQALTPNYLLFCEHPHVYTLGKSGSQENLLIKNEELDQYQATFYKVNRGGDITYHGPGQLVGYPIFDLDNFFTDIHKYLRLLEEVIILTLDDYDMEAGRIEGLTGVWMDHIEQKNPRKICAMGVKSSRWVTMHGFALNVSSDLSYFSHIIPCGIDDKAVTSMESELGLKVDLEEVSERVAHHLSRLFEMQLVDTEIYE